MSPLQLYIYLNTTADRSEKYLEGDINKYYTQEVLEMNLCKIKLSLIIKNIKNYYIYIWFQMLLIVSFIFVCKLVLLPRFEV